MWGLWCQKLWDTITYPPHVYKDTDTLYRFSGQYKQNSFDVYGILVEFVHTYKYQLSITVIFFLFFISK